MEGGDESSNTLNGSSRDPIRCETQVEEPRMYGVRGDRVRCLGSCDSSRGEGAISYE